jgi:hypothetical protein
MARLMKVLTIGITFASLLCPGLTQADETEAANERLAALKESIQRDQASLRQYEWIETTVVQMKGEEKARKQNHCYYGADGKLQKVAVGDQPTEKEKRGLRGKAVAGKKEELSEYMKTAVAAIKEYVPPDPARIQASKDAGKMSIAVLEPQKRVRLDFHDYMVPGDVLGVEIDAQTNKILGVNVTTTLEGDKAPVNFKTSFASLQDGTGYPEKVVLDAKEAGITVNVENSGYKKQASE